MSAAHIRAARQGHELTQQVGMTLAVWITTLLLGFTACAFGNPPPAKLRPHPDALPNPHKPGEVDNLKLAPFVVPNAADLPGVVVDETEAVLVGKWRYSTHTPPYVGLGYLHDQKLGKGESSVTFTPDLPREGVYEVRLSHCYNIRRATNTPVTIHHADGEKLLRINQQQTPKHRRLFRSLGRFPFKAGKRGWVRISTGGTDGKYVIADAVQFIPVEKVSDPPGKGELVRRSIRYGDEVIEQLQLPGKPEITVILSYKKDAAKPMPVMLNWFSARDRKIGELTKNLAAAKGMTITEKLPPHQPVMAELLNRGCALVSFKNSQPKPPPWPEGRAKWIWPTPDPAGAETFARSAKHAPGDWGTVIDWIETRQDLREDRIGYVGGSTTAILGFGLVSMEPRITCAALIAGSGSMREFVEGWKRNYDWKKKGFEVWPETEELFRNWDPVLLVDHVFPTALLMINGSDDRIIPIESARHYYKALRPHYAKDPDRLRFIVFEGAGHGWDQKWNTFMVVDWFDRYLIQEKPPKPRLRRFPRRKSPVNPASGNGRIPDRGR